MRNVLSRLKKLKKYSPLFMAGAAALLMFSCQSVPPKAGGESSAQLLPESSDVIIRASIDGNRDLIEPVLQVLGDSVPEKLSAEFLDRTWTVWAGLDFDSESGRVKSSIAAEGDYPKGLINWGLCWDSGWKKQKHSFEPELAGRMDYWYQKEGQNQLALPSENYILASAGNINEMLDAWALRGAGGLSPEWTEAEKDSDVTIMTRGLTPEDYGRFIPELQKVPLESMVLRLNRDGKDYLVSGRFHMENRASAFLFTTIFRMLIVAAKDENGDRRFPDLKSVKIEMDGSDVVLGGMKLPAEVIAKTERQWIGAAGI